MLDQIYAKSRREGKNSRYRRFKGLIPWRRRRQRGGGRGYKKNKPFPIAREGLIVPDAGRVACLRSAGGQAQSRLILDHDAFDVLHRGDSFLDQGLRGVFQRLHSALLGEGAHGVLVDEVLRLQDHLAELLAHDQRLENPGTAAIPPDAMHAADRLVKGRLLDFLVREPAVLQEIDVHVVVDGLAPLAELAHEALGHDDVDRVREKEGLDPHVIEARDRAYRVVRVERRKDQVPRVGELHGDLRRDLVSHLAHHDHVGVMAKESAKRALEIELVVQLDLAASFDEVFDRVLDRDDVEPRIHDRLYGREL